MTNQLNLYKQSIEEYFEYLENRLDDDEVIDQGFLLLSEARDKFLEILNDNDLETNKLI